MSPLVMSRYSLTASNPQFLQDSVPAMGHPRYFVPSGIVKEDIQKGHFLE